MSIETKKLKDVPVMTTFDKASTFPVIDAAEEGKVKQISGENLQKGILGDAEIGGTKGKDITTNAGVQNLTNKTLRNCEIVNDQGETIITLEDLAEDAQKSMSRYSLLMKETDTGVTTEEYMTAQGIDPLTHYIPIDSVKVESILASEDAGERYAPSSASILTVDCTGYEVSRFILDAGTFSNVRAHLSFEIQEKA